MRGGGVASTIVDMSGDEMRMLREGAVSRSEIESVSGRELT